MINPELAIPIGEITSPSGKVLVMDMGYLYLWGHDRIPVYPEGHGASPEVVEKANSCVEIRLDGVDAERAGKLLERQWHPRYLFDIPRESVPEFEKLLSKVVREHRLDARLTVLPQRISHRERVELVLAHGKGAGEAQVHGIWVPAIGGLPTNRSLRVLAEQMPQGPDDARWARVWLECLSGTSIVRSERVGYAMVDWARLMFADVDALGAWEHDRTMDGQADYVFWGLDAGRLSQLVGAAQIEENRFGWLNLPIEETIRHAEATEETRERHRLKVATDFRPHSHHYAALSKIRSSGTEAGVVTVGDAKLCAFMTTWGDGLFDVYRDFGPEGQLVRVRIEMGTPERIKLMRSLEERWGTS